MWAINYFRRNISKNIFHCPKIIMEMTLVLGFFDYERSTKIASERGCFSYSCVGKLDIRNFIHVQPRLQKAKHLGFMEGKKLQRPEIRWFENQVRSFCFQWLELADFLFF
jgi:hypothetical protein